MRDDIPAWVPVSVGRMAECLLINAGEVGRRLLTDVRMKPIWKSLDHEEVELEAIEALPHW